MAAASKGYLAFAMNDLTVLMNHPVERGYQIEKAESILSKLSDLGADIKALPENLVSKLALAKLLEK